MECLNMRKRLIIFHANMNFREAPPRREMVHSVVTFLMFWIQAEG